MKTRIVLLLFISLPFFYYLILNTVNFFRYRADLIPPSEFKGEHIYSPYRQGKKSWKKIALHLHSNQVFFSQFRHTPEEIYRGYKSAGDYSGIVITDYMRITSVKDLQGWSLPGYEWGCNPKKKHMLNLGSETVIEDPFPLFSGLENIQWVLHRMKEKNTFTVMNHPELNGALDAVSAAKLSGFNAIEVLSVFGTSVHILDSVLSAGRISFAMATDDLHYFSDSIAESIKSPSYKNAFQKYTRFAKENGETMKRYIQVDADELNESALFENLCSGNYISVEKPHAAMPDTEVLQLDYNDGIIAVRLKSRGSISFVGFRGKVLKEETDTVEAEYEVQKSDPYVRVSIVHNGNLVLSNPFFRYDGSYSRLSCKGDIK